MGRPSCFCWLPSGSRIIPLRGPFLYGRSVDRGKRIAAAVVSNSLESCSYRREFAFKINKAV
jgi:hypothetical protein